MNKVLNNNSGGEDYPPLMALISIKEQDSLKLCYGIL